MEFDKLAPDFVALQADLAPLEKSAVNPFFKSRYAPLPEVRAAMQPLLAKHHFGLAVVPAIVEGRNGLRFLLIHKSGQFIEGQWMLTPAKQDSQGEGGDVTYKRRFGEMALVGLVADEDDDGNSVSRTAPQLVGKRPAQTAPAKPASPADEKRAELKQIAAEKGWTLSSVAATYAKNATTGDGKPGELKTATAEEIGAFITSLKAGLVKV